MTSGEIVITMFIGFVSAGLGTLFWARLNRLEDKIDRCARRDELRAVHSDLGVEISSLRSEMASLRSDLTQVALAVGARRPEASEG